MDGTVEVSDFMSEQGHISFKCINIQHWTICHFGESDYDRKMKEIVMLTRT